MLDRLETELIERILHAVKQDSAKTRQRGPLWVHTLFRCCLVSQRLRRIAQPILWQTLHLTNPWQYAAAERALQVPSTTARPIQSIHLARFSVDMNQVTSLLGVKGIGVSVKEVTLGSDYVERIPLEWLTILAGYPGLQRLVLVGWRKIPSGVPCFPSLTTLTVHSADLYDKSLNFLLSTTTLPSLRYLHLHGFRSDGYSMDGDGPLPPPPFVPSFVNQLELLLINIDYYSPGTAVPPYAFRTTPVVFSFRILVNGLDEEGHMPPLLGAHTSHIQHLSLVNLYGADADTTFLSTLASLIRTSSLQTLFLPHDLSSLVRNNVPDRDAQLQRVLEACQDKGVAVHRLSKAGDVQRKAMEEWGTAEKRRMAEKRE
ncbi:hypothetical protein JCM6882_006100 [Rhodosporidiobolus microsporus]